MLVLSELQKHAHLALAYPCRLGLDQIFPAAACVALYLAARDREHGLRRAAIAAHELQPRPKYAVEQVRVDDAVCAASRTGHDHLGPLEVIDRVERRRVPGKNDRHLLGRTADPDHAAGVEADA